MPLYPAKWLKLETWKIAGMDGNEEPLELSNTIGEKAEE